MTETTNHQPPTIMDFQSWITTTTAAIEAAEKAANEAEALAFDCQIEESEGGHATPATHGAWVDAAEKAGDLAERAVALVEQGINYQGDGVDEIVLGLSNRAMKL